jgi:hypothetical protein
MLTGHSIRCRSSPCTASHSIEIGGRFTNGRTRSPKWARSPIVRCGCPRWASRRLALKKSRSWPAAYSGAPCWTRRLHSLVQPLRPAANLAGDLGRPPCSRRPRTTNWHCVACGGMGRASINRVQPPPKVDRGKSGVLVRSRTAAWCGRTPRGLAPTRRPRPNTHGASAPWTWSSRSTACRPTWLAHWEFRSGRSFRMTPIGDGWRVDPTARGSPRCGCSVSEPLATGPPSSTTFGRHWAIDFKQELQPTKCCARR